MKGGVKQIRIATTETFTTAVTLERKHFLKEGQEYPKPEAKKDELADERAIGVGLVYSMGHNVRGIAEADYNTLLGHADLGTEVFIEYTSLDGKRKTIVKGAILVVTRTPVVEFGKIAFARIEATASGTKESDVIAITDTP